MDNPPAWHPDPAGVHDHRWWDGQRWTEHVADAGVASIDPLPDAPPEPGDRTSEPQDGAAPAPQDDAPAEPPAGATSEPGPTPVWGAAASGGDAPPPADRPSTPDAGSSTPWGGAPVAGTSWDQQASWSSGAGNNGMAIGSLVTGILSLPLLLLFGLGTVLGIVAVVLGIIAIRRANRGNGAGRGLAIGGIVTGAISAVLGIVVIIFFVSFGTGLVSEMEACLAETGGDQAECQRRLEDQLTDRFLND